MKYTVLVKRDGGEVELDDRMEDWSKLPRYKQMRPCTPAKMSLTAYGHALEQLRTFGEPSRRPMVESEPTEVPEDVVQLPSVEVLEQGHPPRSIPRHGPGYLRLSDEQKKEISRLHNNLGHPSADMFAKFLGERKAEPEIIQGARDYSCSVCLETVPTVKLSRPSKIHLD